MQEWTIAEIQEKMLFGELTSRQLAEMYLTRIALVDEGDGGINAVIEINPDALVIAEQLDAERAEGLGAADVGERWRTGESSYPSPFRWGIARESVASGSMARTFGTRGCRIVRIGRDGQKYAPAAEKGQKPRRPFGHRGGGKKQTQQATAALAQRARRSVAARPMGNPDGLVRQADGKISSAVPGRQNQYE